MNGDPRLDEELERLGAGMRPGEDFVHRVMDRVNRQEQAATGRWRLAGPWGWAGAVAASLLLAAGLFARFHPRPGRVPTAPDVAGTPVAYQRSTSRWEATFRRPVILPGDSPAWEYRKQEFERVQWTDPTSHATLERDVPRDGAFLIVLDKY